MTEQPTHPATTDDPTVEEIRAIRRRFLQEAEGDLERYIRETREAVERMRAEGELPPPGRSDEVAA